ncbi:hypothetical protein FQR65_LT09417 [Abscondita terminalis]|nr:hypothetical protein FQR65_LT09417 [Abscondita terminalis]
MGAIVSCNKCSSNVTSSVVNLSEAVVHRVADGTEEPSSIKEECVSMEDCAWFEKIECIDDAHSYQNGLVLKNIELHMQFLEKQMKEQKPEFCFTESLVKCLKKNPGCTYKCFKDMKHFVECIEVMRLEKIKCVAELNYMNKKKEKNECSKK